MTGFKGAPLKYLNEVVLVYQGNDCLIWPHMKAAHGYAGIKIDGKLRIATRIICTAIHGEPPTPKHLAAHSCGKGHLACVSPGHISWKTHKENQADRLVHGTDNLGERNHRARLTEADIREIRSLSNPDQKVIAARYGVTQSNISLILSGKRWKHV